MLLWMLTWILVPATLGAALILAILRAVRPDPARLESEALTLAAILTFCLVIRLLAAPTVRPYPDEAEVLARFALIVGPGLGLALALHLILRLLRPRAPR